MVKTMHISGLLTPDRIRQFNEQIQHDQTYWKGRITIFISDTSTDEGNSIGQATSKAISLYLGLKGLPNIQTVAGPNVCNAGFFIFLAGGEKRIMPKASFNLHLDQYVLAAIADESDKDPLAITEILSEGSLDAFRFQQLGISDGYFVGNYNGFLEGLIAARAST